jgi:hypothetical protein
VKHDRDSIFIIGLLSGGVIVWLLMMVKPSKETAALQSEHFNELTGIREGLKASEARIEELRSGIT